MLATLASVLAGGCTVGPNFQMPVAGVPDAFSAKQVTLGERTADVSRWWEILKDPELNQLVERAVANNLSVEIAFERLQIARTQQAVLAGGALPVLNASAGGGRGTGSDISRGRVDSPLGASDSTSNQPKGFRQITQVVGFDASWELDLFGKYRRAAEAAAADTAAAIADRNAVLITVIADVARLYIDMRAQQLLLAALRGNIGVARAYFKLTLEQTERGITNELDLTIAQRQLAALLAEEAPLIAQIEGSRAAIAVLLGAFPEAVANNISRKAKFPTLPENVGKRIPLELLHRRPDIIEAEQQLAAATARIGVATANLFPRVSLTGAWGQQAQGLGVAPYFGSYIWSLGPSISWSVLDFGVLDSLVGIADLQTKLQLAFYKLTVVNAVKEVDVALASYSAQLKRLRSLKDAMTASQRAVKLATERFNRGLTDSLNVIDAQRLQYDLERQYVLAQQTAGENFIALYKALGGGWENYQDLPPIPRAQPAVIAAFTRAHQDVAPVDRKLDE